MVMLYELWPWEVPEYAPWSWIIAFYLFLGGVGAGALVTASLADLIGRGKYRDISKSGVLISPIVLIIGSILLLFDLGDPLRGIQIPRAFVNTGSWLAIGAWLLMITIILGFTYAYTLFRDKSRGLRVFLAIIGILLGIAVGTYTGLLLRVLQFIPLWHSDFLPLLFVLSALSTGLAATLFFPLLTKLTEEKMKTVHRLSIVDDAIVAFEILVLAIFIDSVSKTNAFGMESVAAITTGVYSLLFWVGVIGIGLVAPLFLSTMSLTVVKHSRTLPIIEFTCVLIGGLLLRLIIIYAAIKQPIFFPVI